MPSQNFVGRTEELVRLHQGLQTANGVVISAIAGMGGLGKTELAVQYATHHLPDYAGGVCWLTARSLDIATQILQIAVRDLRQELPAEFQTGQVPLAEQVQWCWRHWRPDGRVLVVLDDVNDWAACQPYLPREPRFRLLLTTRAQDLARQFAVIALDVLTPDQARRLLADLEKLGRVGREPETAEQICAALGYLPLAIELVGRYLANDRFLTLADLWQQLQQQGLSDPSLSRPETAEMTARHGVRAAFELTWQGLEADSQTVARLLSLFAPAAIPWSVAEAMMQRVQGQDYAIRPAQRQLDNASMVQAVEEDLSRCTLHPLIREFLRQKHQQAVQATGDRTLLTAFLSELMDWAKQMPQTPITREILQFTPMRPHWQEVAEHYIADLPEDDLTWVFWGLGRFYDGQGFLSQAEPWWQAGLEATQRLFEGDHADVASSLNNLAYLYRAQGRLTEAEPLYQQALTMRQRLFEGDHPAVASSLNNLAYLYQARGRLSEAEPLYQQALTMRQRLFEGDHPDVAQSLNNLAYLYNAQGRLSEAEPLYQQSLTMFQQTLGVNHPNTQTVQGNLAALRQAMSDSDRP